MVIVEIFFSMSEALYNNIYLKVPVHVIYGLEHFHFSVIFLYLFVVLQSHVEGPHNSIRHKDINI